MKIIKHILPVILALFIASCSSSPSEGEDAGNEAQEEVIDTDDPLMNKGIGPISSIDLGELNQDIVAQGKELFKANCTTCHKVDQKHVGPSPKGILDRRSPEWVMNMILNPEEMLEDDPIAMELYAEYNYSPMANQNLTEEEARAILEYFRTL